MAVTVVRPRGERPALRAGDFLHLRVPVVDVDGQLKLLLHEFCFAYAGGRVTTAVLWDLVIGHERAVSATPATGRN